MPLLRPGRFDRQVLVDRPDLSVKPFSIHARKSLGADVELRAIATVPGFAGADLANLLMKQHCWLLIGVKL